MAPEGLRPKHMVDYGKPADVWAFGVTAYVLLSGSMPFYAESEMEVFSLIQQALA